MTESGAATGSGSTPRRGSEPSPAIGPLVPASPNAACSSPDKGGSTRQQQEGSGPTAAASAEEAAGGSRRREIVSLPLSSAFSGVADGTTIAEEQGQDVRENSTTLTASPVADACAAGRGESSCGASESGQHTDTASLPPVPPLALSAHTRQSSSEDGALVKAATTGTHRTSAMPPKQQPHAPLENLVSTTSTPFPTLSTSRQSKGGGGAGNCGGGDGGGGNVVRGVEGGRGLSYRSVSSCPAIGATSASPLLGRNELTDSSALERSRRLVREGLLGSIIHRVGRIARQTR